jgi:two-component system chemotaxis sensor kinase CheA
MEAVETLKNRSVLRLEGKLVPLVYLGQLLGLGVEAQPFDAEKLPVVLLKSEEKRLGVAVDEFMAPINVLIKRIGLDLSGRPYLLGGFMRGDGTVSLALNPAMLVERASGASAARTLQSSPTAQETRSKSIRVVDDSITTRSLEKSVLEASGYRVFVAVDGIETLSVLQSESTLGRVRRGSEPPLQSVVLTLPERPAGDR